MSIQHFSALSNKRQQEFIKYPERFMVQEKIDGSNFKFKFDDAFPWATRKTKSGPVYTTPDEWGFDAWVTGFRAAHTFMIQCIEPMKHMNRALNQPFLPEGTMLESELLFADTPNTIIYDNEVSHVIVYDPVAWGSYTITDLVQLNDVPYTDDGYTILRTSKQYRFSLNLLKTKPTFLIDFESDEYRSYTAEETEAYFIKKLQHTVSEYSSDALTARVEGMVVKHKDDKWMFKFVDRDWFTETNKRNYKIRGDLFKSARGHKHSLMDSFWDDIKQGHKQSFAAKNALVQLDTMFEMYLKYDQQKEEAHVHKRNLMAFASIRAQLNDYASGTT